MPKSLRQPSKILLAVGLALGLAAILTEGFVRVFADEPIQPRFVVDSGHGIRANQGFMDTRHSMPGEYEVDIHTNSAGMRGTREYPFERTVGTPRVLLLGDSFVFGYGVEDEEVVSAALERVLEERGRAGAEVVNLAVSGFGQAEELITWRSVGVKYRPDLVAVFYFENDIGNNVVSGLFEMDPEGGVERTGASFLPGSRLQERMLAFPPTRWLFEHSQAWNLLRNRLSGLVQGSMLRDQGLESYRDATPEAAALTEALLLQLFREVRDAGATPVLVVIPDGKRGTSNLPVEPERLEELGIRVLDGRDFLEEPDYFPRDSHWRASGHRKVAERLADIVLQADRRVND